MKERLTTCVSDWLLVSLGPGYKLSIGLQMDDHTIRIFVGLRLGTPLCQPHTCHHCGCNADALATHDHGLSCIKSQGHFSRHVAINAIIHRSLAAVNVPCRSDGKRLDICSIAPWKSGQCLVWDIISFGMALYLSLCEWW